MLTGDHGSFKTELRARNTSNTCINQTSWSEAIVQSKFPGRRIDYSAILASIINDSRRVISLAESTQTDTRILSFLAYTSDMRVKCALADNPQTPVEALLRLAHDRSSDLRYQLAENHNLPLQVLCVLATDDNPYVNARAQQTLARLSKTHR